MALKSQCPNCSKILNLKTKAALGKRVPCPKCKQPFVVEPYEEEEYYEDEDGWEDDGYEEDAYDDGYEDDYDDGNEDDYDEPPRRSKGGGGGGSKKGAAKAKGKGKGKKRAKPGGMPVWAKGLLAGGGGALVLALLIFGIMSLIGGSGSGSFNFAYLPSNSEAVIAIKPAEIWNSKMLQPIRNNQAVNDGLGQLKKFVPGTINDVESIVMAFPKVDFNSQKEPEMLMVVHLNKDITVPTAFAKEVDHNGTKYYDIGNGKAGWQPEPTIVIIGDQAQIVAAIDRGKTDAGDTSRFSFANTDHQFVAAYAPEGGLETSEIQHNNPLLPQPSSTNEKVNGAYMGFSIHSGVDIEIGLDCKSSAQARTRVLEANEELVKQKAEFDKSPFLMVVPEEYISILKSTVNSASVDSSGSVFSVSMSVPGEISDLIAKGVDGAADQINQQLTRQIEQMLPSGGGKSNGPPGMPNGSGGPNGSNGSGSGSTPN